MGERLNKLISAAAAAWAGVACQSGDAIGATTSSAPATSLPMSQPASAPGGYVAGESIRVGAGMSKSIAAGDGLLLTAGDGGLAILNRGGAAQAVSVAVSCVAISRGEIFAGVGSSVQVFDKQGRLIRQWSVRDAAVLTSIAADERNVYVADAANRVVWRFDRLGSPLGCIGKAAVSRVADVSSARAEGVSPSQIQEALSAGGRDVRAARGQDARDAESVGFVVPSPYFDVIVSPDGLLRVANPGMHRIEARTADGQLEFHWGVAGTGEQAFPGCCNPAQIAILPDGRLVTSDKGAIRRIRIWKSDGPNAGTAGQLDVTVAGPTDLGPGPGPLDLVVGADGTIYALDSAAGIVRVYKPVLREGRP